MSVYACSDIHGMYNSYMKLINILQLGAEDILYVLGDVIDRGSDGLHIIDDIMHRDNVKLFLGNHELFLLDTFGRGKFNEDVAWLWCLPNNGGYPTLKEFQSYTAERQIEIINFLNSCFVIKIIEVNGKKFHLSHSSTLSELKTNELRVTDMEYEDCHHVVWNHVLRHGDTMDFYDNYKKDYTYISGHVRVQKLGKGKCTKLRNIIDIDCGCSYGLGNSSLCCVRLDDMKEYYIT